MLLAEELVLLALDDESGKLATSTSGYFNYALAGALLLDLVLANKIDIQNKKVLVLNPQPMDDELLQMAFQPILESKKPKDIGDWVYKIGNNYAVLRDTISHRMQNAGILGREEKKVLKIFTSVHHPILKPDLKYAIFQRIEPILMAQAPASDRDIALLSLLKCANLINSLFTKEFRKQISEEIKKIVKNEKIGKAVSDLIAGINASFVAIYAATSYS
jgi:hypothetical protein